MAICPIDGEGPKGETPCRGAESAAAPPLDHAGAAACASFDNRTEVPCVTDSWLLSRGGDPRGGGGGGGHRTRRHPLSRRRSQSDRSSIHKVSQLPPPHPCTQSEAAEAVSLRKHFKNERVRSAAGLVPRPSGGLQSARVPRKNGLYQSRTLRESVVQNHRSS